MKQQFAPLFAGGLLALAVVNATIAGPFEDGQAAYRRGDYATAMRLWRSLADRANARAQLAIGDMYYNGDGVRKDYAQAAAWYRRAAEIGLTALKPAKPTADAGSIDPESLWIGPQKSSSAKSPAPKKLNAPVPDLLSQWNNSVQRAAAAAAVPSQNNIVPDHDYLGEALTVGQQTTKPLEPTGPLEEGEAAVQRGDYATAMQLWRTLGDNGNAPAQAKIGNLYWNGNGVPTDFKQAIAWWRKAADQGNPEAQTDIGGMYFDGNGVPQDFVQAAAWYLKAANQGYRVAQDRVGGMYERGQGVGQDLVQAHMWFNLAGSSEKDSTLRQAWITDRNEVAGKMTPAQIAEAQRLASEWTPKL